MARARRLSAPVLALAALGVLAACGSQQQARTPAASSTQIRSTTPPGPPGDPWGPWIREASARFDVPEAWIREVMRQESGGRAHVTSRAGAMGLMQVMPATYRELQARHGLGDDPYHPYDSIMAGTAYLRQMYDLFGSPAFLAAYNAGPGRLEGFLYNRRGLPPETRNYVARVGPGVIRHSPSRRAPAEIYAAAEIPLQVPPGPRRMDAATRLALAEQRQIREQGAMFASRTPAPAPAPAAAAPPVVLASAPAPAPVISPSGGRVLPDGRIVVAAMDPIPDGSTPEGAARLAESQGALPPLSDSTPPALPVAAAPARGLGLIGTAQASTLPASFRQAPRPASALVAPVLAAPTRTASTLAAPTLTAPARATPVAMARPSAPAASWGVQVGAFRSPEQARRAAANAQTQARSGGMVQVMAVQVSQGTLFRARITGLNQAAAQQACARLSGGCAVVAPE
ncbi:lytic transglycosylase domain-containing protein [Roseococcus microcysteis]|uniref:lytic transglycosylase domain-containing protein n=1 Tax=Roseococcus microcysteis TaxID=2771361 RepID=UPI001CC54D34|nr:lytic transglycosylase domain-containing protein [Roseococcus microcysteis]